MLTLQSIAMNQPGCSVNPCAANTFFHFVRRGQELVFTTCTFNKCDYCLFSRACTFKIYLFAAGSRRISNFLELVVQLRQNCDDMVIQEAPIFFTIHIGWYSFLEVSEHAVAIDRETPKGGVGGNVLDAGVLGERRDNCLL